MKRLEGKVAIITGGASGIGEAAVRKFVAEGACVLIADVQESRGEQLAGLLGDSALFQKTDVSSEAEMRALVDLAVERFGRLDVMYNNAGFGFATRAITDTPVEEFDIQLAVLLRGTFLGIKHAGVVMKRQRSGSIVNTSSVAAIAGGFSNHVYSAAKAGVISLTRTAALELGECGVRVNCICPGSIPTPIFVRGIPLNDEEVRRALDTVAGFMTHNPMTHCGSPEDVANAALWLASNESGYVNGQSIVVDGGLTCGVTWSDMERWLNALYGKLASQFPAAFANITQ